MHGRGACMAGSEGVCGRGCACLEVVYVAGGVHGWGAGVHGRGHGGHAWQGGMRATADTMGYGQ